MKYICIVLIVCICIVSQSSNQATSPNHGNMNKLIALEMMGGDMKDMMSYNMLSNNQNNSPVDVNQLATLSVLSGGELNSETLIPFAMMKNRSSATSTKQSSGNRNQNGLDMNTLVGLEMMDGISDNILPFAMMNGGIGHPTNHQHQNAPVLEQTNPNNRPHQSGMNNMLPAMALMDGVDMKDIVTMEMMTGGGLSGQQSGNQNIQTQRMNQLIGLEMMDGISDNILPFAIMNGMGPQSNYQRASPVLEQLNPNTRPNYMPQNGSMFAQGIPGNAIVQGAMMGNGFATDMAEANVIASGLSGQKPNTNMLVAGAVGDSDASQQMLEYEQLTHGSKNPQFYQLEALAARDGDAAETAMLAEIVREDTPQQLIQAELMGNEIAADALKYEFMHGMLPASMMNGGMGQPQTSETTASGSPILKQTSPNTRPQTGMNMLPAMALMDGVDMKDIVAMEMMSGGLYGQRIQNQQQQRMNQLIGLKMMDGISENILPFAMMNSGMGPQPPHRTAPVLKQGRPNVMTQNGSMFTPGIPGNTIVQGAMMGNDFATDMAEANVMSSGLSGQKPNTNMLVAGAVGDSDASQQMLEYEQLTHGTKNPQFYQLEALAARDGDAAETAMLAEIVREDTPQQLIQAEMMGNDIAADALKYEFMHGMIPASMMNGRMSNGPNTNQQPVLKSTHVQPLPEERPQTNNILPAMALMDGVDLKDLMTVEMMSGGFGGPQGKLNHQQQRINQLIGLEMMDGISDNILPFAMMNNMGTQSNRPRGAPVLEQSNPNGRRSPAGINSMLPAMALMDEVDMKDIVAVEMMTGGLGGQQPVNQNQQQQRMNQLIGLELMDGISDNILPFVMMNGGVGQQTNQQPVSAPVLNRIHPFQNLGGNNTHNKNTRSNGLKHGIRNVITMEMIDGDVKDLMTYRLMNNGQAVDTNTLISLEMMDGTDNVLPLAMMNGGSITGPQQPAVIPQPRYHPVLEQNNPNTRRHRQPDMNSMLPAMALMDGDMKDLVAIEMMTGGLGGQSGNQNQQQPRINQLIGLEMMDGISDNILPFAMMNGQGHQIPRLQKSVPNQNLPKRKD